MNESNAELTRLWEQAVDEYISKSKRYSVAQRWKRPITTQEDLKNLIEQHESDFERFRGSRKKIWDILLSTMKQLQSLGSVAKEAVKLSPFAPTAVILEAGLFVISSGAAVAETYDNLETLFRRIRDVTDRLEEYLQGTVDQKLLKVVVQLLSSLLDVFIEAEAVIERGRGKEMMRRAVGKDNKIQSALDRLDDYVQTEMALITANTYVTAQRIEENAGNERESDLLRRVLNAEVAADNEAFGKRIEASRLSRSGDWLLKAPLFDRWTQQEFPVLWVLGKPGTGKTYLASRILTQLRQESALSSFFYIREGMNTQHTPEVMLKAIAYQLTGLSQAYRGHAIAACKEMGSLILQESIWENLFITPFSSDPSKPLFIIIDGIDEATKSNQASLVELAKKLSDLRSTTHPSPAIQLLFLGRPEIEYNVSNAWREEKRQPKILHVEPFLSKPDIERFIEQGVTKEISLLQKMRTGPSKRLRRDIIKTICASSDGMFMLAKLMLAEVKDMNKPELIKHALIKPPKGLDNMYKRVIERLDAVGGFDKEDLNELIMWVACAKRDLLLGELDLVLKLRNIDQGGIIALKDELETRFGSLFNVMYTDVEMKSKDEEEATFATGSDTTSARSTSGESGGSEDEASSGASDLAGNESDYDGCESDDEVPPEFSAATVKFSHTSVGQHFRTSALHKGIGMDFKFAQGHIALTCVQSLTDNIPKRMERPWREPDLFEYSVNHFLDHFAEIDFDELKFLFPALFEKLSTEVAFLFKDRISIRRWFHALSDKHKFLSQIFSQTTDSRLQKCIPKFGNQDISSMKEETLDARSSMEGLLEPFAHYVVQAWLVHGNDPMFAVLFLQGYMCIRDRQNLNNWCLPAQRPFRQIVESISPDVIREMASIGGLQKNMNWHVHLGRTFYKINTHQHLQSAVEEFDKAIGIQDPSARLWMVYWAKAEALFALRQFEDVIPLVTQTLERLPTQVNEVQSRLHLIIQKANMELTNWDAALDIALKAWKSAPDEADCALNLIIAAHSAGSYMETVKLMRSALESGKEARFIGQILIDSYPHRTPITSMLFACAKLDELDLARDAFQAVKSEAASCNDRTMMAAANAALGRLYFEFYEDYEKAVALWHQSITNYPSTLPSFVASFDLMPWYYTRANNADESEVQTWVTKMEQLVETTEAMSPEPRMFPTFHEASMLLGKWYANHGELEQARTKIRPSIRESIRELTDRDDGNDFQAYAKLARGLCCFGDRSNAAVAFAFLFPTRIPEQLQQQRSHSSAAPNSKVDLVIATYRASRTPFKLPSCDGECNRSQTLYRSFHMCEICVDIGFCDECLQSLLDGKLAFRICNPDHPLFEIYPPKGLVMKDTEGYKVHLDEEKGITRDEWLGMISREWIGEDVLRM